MLLRSLRMMTAGLFERFSLRALLISLLVAELLLVAGFITLISRQSSGRVVSGVVEQLLDATMSEVSRHLSEYLSVPHRLNRSTIAALRAGILDGDPDRAIAYFWEQGQAFPDYGTIAWADERGALRGANQPEGYIVLADPRETGGAIRRYSPTPDARRGALLRDVPGYDARTRGWYREALAAGRPSWTGIALSATGPRLDLTAVAPCRDAAGRFRGVAYVDVSLTSISAFLESLRIGRSGVAIIIEPDGTLIASSTGREPFERAPGGDLRRVQAAASGDPVVEAAASLLVTNSGIGKSVTREFALDGRRYYLRAEEFRDVYGLDWIVAAAIPREDFMAPIQEGNRATLLLTLVALLVAVAAGILITEWIVRPLRHLSAAARAMAGGQLGQTTSTSRRDDIGRLARSFDDMARRLEGMFGELNREVSDRRQAEEDLRRAKDELQRKYEELRSLDVMKDGLLRDVTHELRTPVAKQAMQLELLRLRLGEECRGRVSSIVATMEESVRRQESVIRNILHLARLEAGGRKFNIKPIDAGDILRDVVEEYRPFIEEASLTIDVDLPPLAVMADPEMLWHVFSNLISNAIKHRRRGLPGMVRLTARPEGADGVFRIEDDGAGLAPAEQARVFERFYQASAAIEGSGVGLTICKLIVDQMDGSISLSSPGKGKGTTAEVRLPLAPTR